MDDFYHERKLITKHIPSSHGKEMSTKSTVARLVHCKATTTIIPICINMQVPLGIQLLSENNLNDMRKILENFHKLVSSHHKEGHHTLPNGEILDFDDTSFFTVLLGGDQLIVARARGAQAMRASYDRPSDRLEGIIPVVEDWHSWMTLMRVVLFFKLYASYEFYFYYI